MATHAKSPKPTKPYSHRMTTSDGKHIDCHQDPLVVGAWLALDNSADASLSVQSVNQGGAHQIYAGYRDGKTQADKLAISVEESGEVFLQVVLTNRNIKQISLQRLEELVADEENI